MDLHAYLQRIMYNGSLDRSFGTLRTLHPAHQILGDEYRQLLRTKFGIDLIE
jgi:hypothetical protein